KKVRHHFYDALLPHERNAYKPLLFTLGGVATVIALALLLQAAYFVQTKVVFKETNFLASVLPGVLATLTNQDRAKAGIPALEEDAHLARAAQLKAEDMAAKGYFSHVDPEGRQPWYWLDHVGYPYSYAGENLAVNFTDSEDVQEAWMNSPTHHANIVKSQYTRIGIGVAQGTYQGRETTFVVQFFSTPRASATTAAPVETPVEPASAVAAGESGGEEQVLGVEVGTVVSEPAVEPRDEASPAPEEPVAITPEESAPVSVDAATGFFAQVAASPTHTLTYILAALAVLVGVLLTIAVVFHAKVAYREVLSGGFAILVVSLSLLAYNAMGTSSVKVPSGGQEAAAVEAL
ncbi:MAG TPA: CAP domain-containing protein, partial [Candidatus Paceibacterota bacterium]